MTPIVILAIATFVRAMLGFGEALIAVPLLALLMPIEQAAPVAVLVSITIAAIVLALDWRHVHFASAWSLLLSTLAGIPIGLYALTAVPELLVKAALALIIAAFAAYSLWNHRTARLHDDHLAWAFGFQAGILGGAYGMNGPPLVIYGSLRAWPPERFRATLQAYFLPASIAGMAGYWFAGLWTAEVTGLYWTSLPAVVIATLAGRFAAHKTNPARFRKLVHIGLLLTAAVLFLQSMAAR